MALLQTFYGFEDPPLGLDPALTDLGHNGLITDGTAWSGLRYLENLFAAGAPGLQSGVQNLAALPAFLSGQPFWNFAYIYFRVSAPPSLSGCQAFGFVTNARVEMNPGMHLRIRGPVNSLNLSAYSTQALLPGVWYRMVVQHYGVAKTAGRSNSGRSRSRCDVYLAAGNVYQWSVLSIPQQGSGCASSGDSPIGTCLDPFQPFSRELMIDGTASFVTLQGLGIVPNVLSPTGYALAVSWLGGGDAYAPGVAGLYQAFVDETTATNQVGCFRGNTGGTYSYIEHGTLSPFSTGGIDTTEDLRYYTIDDGLSVDTFFLGQNASGVSCERRLHYDNVQVSGASGPPPYAWPPPAPMPIGWVPPPSSPPEVPPPPDAGALGCVVTFPDAASSGGVGCVVAL